MASFRFRFKKRGEGWTRINIDENGVMHIPDTSFRNANTTALIRSFVDLLIHENWTDADVKEMP